MGRPPFARGKYCSLKIVATSSASLNLTMQEAPRTGVNASHFGVQVASSEDVAAAWTRFTKASGGCCG